MGDYPIKVFSDYLDQLSVFLEKIENAVEGDTSILEARLSHDMFPLMTQVEIAANFSLRSCCPIAGLEVVNFAQQERSFLGLQTQLRQTIEFLHGLNINNSDLSDASISDKAGPAIVTLPTLEFLNRFALPNFFFHISMVYAIAKANGIPATKGDYDRFHDYPDGFSFEE